VYNFFKEIVWKSGNFALSSQTQSDKTFQRFPNILADFRNLLTPCVRVVTIATGERSFSHLKLIKLHNHVAREIDGSSHVTTESGTSSHEGHCQSVCQKRPGRQSFMVCAGFFVYMNVARGTTYVNNTFINLVSR